MYQKLPSIKIREGECNIRTIFCFHWKFTFKPRDGATITRLPTNAADIISDNADNAQQDVILSDVSKSILL